MSETKTLTQAAVASAADKAAARVAGAMTKTKSVKSKRFDKSKAENFDPTRVVAYQNPQFKDDTSVCWLKDDGKTPDPKSQAEIELPPFLIAQGSKIVGEGDAFKEVQNKKGVKISRGAAHFRLVLVKEVSDDMDEIYPEWRPLQEKVVTNVRKAGIKLLTDTFNWKNPPGNWVPFINAAWKAARDAISIPNRKELTDDEIETLIEESEDLKRELREKALSIYLRDGRYPFKVHIDKATKQELPTVVGIESKVYATKDFKEDVYTNENKGPDEISFPSDNEHIGDVIEIMRNLPGKGGKGFDARVYTPIVFVNGMAKREPTARELKAERRAEKAFKKAVEEAKRQKLPLPIKPKKPDPIEDRPNVTLKDGRVVPDYWWNPLTRQNGRQIQSYGVAVAGFMLTASEIGGYGVKFIHRASRKIWLIDYEDVPERQISVVGKRVHESDREEKPEVDDDNDDDDDDDDDDGDDDEGRGQSDPKRRRTGEAQDEPPQQGSPPPTPPPQQLGASDVEDDDFNL